MVSSCSGLIGLSLELIGTLDTRVKPEYVDCAISLKFACHSFADRAFRYVSQYAFSFFRRPLYL